MSAAMKTATPGRRIWRGGAVGRGIVLAVVTIVLCIFLYGSTSEPSAASAGVSHPHPGDSTPGMVRIPLATKDRAFQVIPPSRGGATGSVWYRSRGPTLPLELRAAGLVPDLRYRLDLFVAGTVYPVARLRADDAGTVRFDTTLTALSSGAHMGADTVPPRPFRGTMAIRFWVQRDGSPGANGDGDFSYVLYEQRVAEYAATVVR